MKVAMGVGEEAEGRLHVLIGFVRPLRYSCGISG